MTRILIGLCIAALLVRGRGISLLLNNGVGPSHAKRT